MLAIAIVAVLAFRQTATAQKDAPPPRVTSANPDDAWKLLPRKGPTLPAWALVLVESLPKATGAMLDLDYLHRAKNPLGPVLSGKLRWVAAETIGCNYAKRYAEFDLRQAGLRDDDLKKLSVNGNGLPDAEKAAIQFARKMTKAAHTVTDEEVAELLKLYGPEKVVAMVHTLAHANFQNRLFLALAIEVEKDGPLPPLDLQLDPRQRAKVPAPARPAWDTLVKAKTPMDPLTRPVWREFSFDELEKSLESQKARKSRIPLLKAEQLAHLAPQERGPATRIIWSNVSMGYQPALTRAWFECMGYYGQESPMPRVVKSSMFWVLTRSIECFY